eukprot:4616937-Amphidinium_carterae.1
MLNVTSTKVRAALAEWRMPKLYSREAQMIIMKTLSWPKAKTKADPSGVVVRDGAFLQAQPPQEDVKEESKTLTLVENRPPLPRRKQQPPQLQ